MSKDTGMPAFPATEQNGLNSGNSGMTLRDYFAAKAIHWCLDDLPGMADWAEEAAKSAYKIADAMLAERAK